MNLSPKNKWPRQVQIVRCCGIKYKRWRYRGGKFPMTHFLRCCRCGLSLCWQAKFKAHDRSKGQRLGYHARSAAMLQRGLTTRGQARKKSLLRLPTEELRRRMLARYHARAKKFLAAGLNSRGQERTYKPRHNRIEKSFLEFRAGLNLQRPELLGALERGEEAV